MKLFFLILLSFVQTMLIAQTGLGYFSSSAGEFVVFDKGNTSILERIGVTNVQVGDDYLAYVDAMSNLKVYYNNETYTIEGITPGKMVATTQGLVYKMQNRLMIFEKGLKKQLSNWVDAFFAGEEIVVWVDLPSYDLMAYRNGEIVTIEKSAGAIPVKELKVGRNIIAYNDLNNHFKIYYNGIIYDSKTSNIMDFKCGNDIVAYYDKFNNEFKVFYKGEFILISPYAPKEYGVGDNQLVYLDVNDYFIVFYDKKIIKLLSYRPENFTIKNSIIYYNYQNELFVFYKGISQSLEKFVTLEGLSIGYNSLFYIDGNNYMRYFYAGKLYPSVLLEKINSQDIIRDLPIFSYASYATAFFYNGKLYDYSSIRTKSKK